MAKSETQASPAQPVADHITINEFCTRLSKSDRRVELIGAFNFSEVQAGRIKDAEAAYQSRFTAFANRPV